MQNRTKFTAAFRRIFSKGSNEQEKKNFARWFSQLDLSDGKIFQDEAEEAEMESRMEKNLHDYVFRQTSQTPIVNLKPWISVAAAVIILITAGALFTISRSKIDTPITYAQYSTRAGERKVITLSDGSTVTLSNLSRISVPNNFSNKVREISISGEAFFNVVHDQKKPFIVRAGKLKVQVLGTSFDVRNYQSDRTVAVVVATGKVGVMVKGNKDAWMLTPGRQLVYNSTTENTIKSIVDPSDYTGWKNGELRFNNDRLEDICKRLERWYGVTITIKNEALKDKRITLKQDNESLNTVLRMLGRVGGYDFKIYDKNVEIW